MDPVIAHNAGKLLELVERSAFVGFWRFDARRQQLYWSEQLARLLQSFTRDELLAMAQAARKLGKPNATEMIANELEEIALK